MISIVSICLTLVICTAIKDSKILLVKTNDINTVESLLGDKAAYALNYKILALGKYSLVFPQYITLDSIKVRKFTGDKASKFTEIVNRVSDVKYNIDNSDPRTIFEEGGNCQAISLVLLSYFKVNGIEAEPVLDNGVTHMYVRAKLEDKSYLVDMVEKTIKEE